MQQLHSLNDRTVVNVETACSESTAAEIGAAAEAAHACAAWWGASSRHDRSRLLQDLATTLEIHLQELVSMADDETALGTSRLNGEVGRTSYQLRRFAELALKGLPFQVVDDPAIADPPPVGHPAMQMNLVPVGVVAMFAASNFPFAFSVLGGDTASALAAGCPVVIKAHPGHPRLSRQLFDLVQGALRERNYPPGLIGMVQGAGG